MPVRPAANYLAYRTELEAIDETLQRSGLDDFILDGAIAERRRHARDDAAFHRGLAAFVRHTRSAFRIGILRAHKGCASVRSLEITLADSPLEQWFCFLESFDQIKAPGKSTIDRAKNRVAPAALDAAFAALLQRAASAPGGYDPHAEQAINLLGLEVPADLAAAWYDSTCHCPDIHFPVDWVQLGDCCRTLLKATLCIRRHGIRNRMPKGGAGKLLHDLNGLNIALGNARRRKDSKKLRKKILREMKRFSGRMAHHARAHRELLVEHRAGKTDLTVAQAAQITGRIDHVLAVLPRAKKQAHERIIGGRRVPSAEKVISVYEPDAKVIVRGKSGAEVEFGNQLVLGENAGGLIVYWKLCEDVRVDSNRMLEAVETTEANTGKRLGKAVADRGFSDEKMQAQLAVDRPDLADHICPLSPAKLAEKKGDPGFMRSQTRRAQTEARVAIITNSYQRGRSLSKGLGSQRQELRWVMLAHNLRLLARQLNAERAAREKAQRQAA
jgi:hypothetical protein